MSSYKYFNNNDRVVGSNLLFEEVSSERGSMWTSSSFNMFVQYGTGSQWPTSEHLFDVTFGRSSTQVSSSDPALLSKEQNIYNQFAKVLLGHDETNAIKKFQLSFNSDLKQLNNAYFINFARSKFGDKIKEGSVELVFNVSGSTNLTLKDISGSSGTDTAECPTGHYGKLFVSSSSEFTLDSDNEAQGLVFYEAGVAVISPYIFSRHNEGGTPEQNIKYNPYGVLNTDSTGSLSGSSNDLEYMVLSGSINDNCHALASHLLTASYMAATELNSTIYFCRAYNHEFNYSSNPTYVSGGQIVVKGGDVEVPTRTYVTSVGLYSDDNQLLAVAKLSEPVIKTPQTELIARVRLDF